MCRSIGVFAALVLASACGSATEPTSQLPALGTYSHTATDQGATYSGTFALTYATADSIAGTWNVLGYAAAPRRGFRQSAGYALTADRPGELPVTFTLSPSASGFACSGQVLVLTPDGTVNRPVSCTMTH